MHSQHLPAVRVSHQKRRLPVVSDLSDLAARNDDVHTVVDAQSNDKVTDSLLTLTETSVSHGSTVLNTEIITTQVPVQPSSSSSSAPSSRSSEQSHASSSSSSSSVRSSGSSETSSTARSSSVSSASNTSRPSSSVPSSTNQPSSSGHATISSYFSLPSATPTPSPGNNQASSESSLTGAGTKPKGLSGGAIGGITAGSVAVVLALLIFVVRKRFFHRKERRLHKWLQETTPRPEIDASERMGDLPFSNVSSDTASANVNFTRDLKPSSPVGGAGMLQADMRPMRSYAPSRTQTQFQPSAPRMAPPPIPSIPVPQPPPMSYNSFSSSMPAGAPKFHPASLTPAVPLAPTPTSGVSFALVRAAFIPSLPDELSVSAGEMVRVITEYDDGWALCANLQGEQGVVPLECLQRQRGNVSGGAPTQSQQQTYPGQGTGDWRMSQRGNSLYSAQGPAVMRY
ncbi:hypothetical protein AcW1_006313 [Taiwanofungus camphoratus]|nr:hypothetical protein AcW1_006313 [Antrodia cinnamomea]KAI0958144.1 hypothetical protein AcW1_006313 [Antrodia cinnamomea]